METTVKVITVHVFNLHGGRLLKEIQRQLVQSYLEMLPTDWTEISSIRSACPFLAAHL